MLAKIFLKSLVTTIGVTAVSAAQLQQIQNFGDNPTKIEMHLYVPDNVAENPVVIVGVCR